MDIRMKHSWPVDAKQDEQFVSDNREPVADHRAPARRRGGRALRAVLLALASVLAGLMYVAVFGASVLASIERLTTSRYDIASTATSPAAALDNLLTAVSAVIVGILSMQLLVLRPPWTGGDRRWNVAIASWGLMLLVLGAGAALLIPALGDHVHSPFGAEDPVATTVLDALRAGISEEFLVLAIPATLMRISKCPWPVGLMILFVLRMLYHLYYGIPGALWLAPWALLAAACFWRWTTWPVLAGFVALHALFNMRGLVPAWHEYYTLGIGALFLAAAGAAVLRTPPGARRHEWRASIAPQVRRPLAWVAMRINKLPLKRVPNPPGNVTPGQIVERPLKR
jgi:hypothetical protein